MALTPEDKSDVSRSMGKALANRVSKVTKDSKWHGPRGTIGKTLAYNKSDSPEMTGFKRSYSRKIQKREKSFNKGMNAQKREGMSKDTVKALEKGDFGAFTKSFMK